ncbi:hypothetical protein EDE08_104590 [Bradyrhizobium sp. R2.2-H]|nr:MULTISPECIES: hypothetical protein [unclassified Bradyrhizobium]TCU73397.1 hypothetical protein EDE10_10453 [Bradyrhizobium sp. Y-H1]TCU76414.1 hypothetical protein EDE08_104590 [Bradyrhizobium sp. R2.2-H]
MIKAALPDRLIMRSVPVYGEGSVEIARSYERGKSPSPTRIPT